MGNGTNALLGEGQQQRERRADADGINTSTTATTTALPHLIRIEDVEASASVSAEQEQETIDSPPILAGRWQLEGMIGSGAMGSVYRARDLELDEIVALKIVSIVDAESLARFRDEVRLARKVTHPNVARTFDIGEHAGTRFLTMEYVEGESLRREIARGRLSLRRAREISRDVCEGLAAVHEQGVVHGDVKPENILMSAIQGKPLLSDFGLSRSPLAAIQHTGLGTPVYMAPEQLLGLAPASFRTDTYSFGVLLFELFAGHRPWTGAPAVVAAMKMLESETAAVVIPTDVPRDVADVIAQCLSHDPSARPAKAADVLQLLIGLNWAAVDEEESSAGASWTDPSSIRLVRRLAASPSSSSPVAANFLSSLPGTLRVAVRELRVEDKSDAYLAVALATDIVRVLGTAQDLHVHGTPIAADDLRDLRGQFDACVEGTVRRVGQTIRIALRVRSVNDEYLLWGRARAVSPERALSEIASCAKAIVRTLSISLSSSGSSASSPPSYLTSPLRSPEVLEAYLRARHAEHHAWNEIGTSDIELYEELEKIAPDDPLTLALHAGALTRKGGLVPDAEARARALAERALHLAPELAEAHLALGLVLFTGNDHEGAARATLRAASLSPSLATAQSVIGNLLCEVGRMNEGLMRIDLALALEPRLGIAWSTASLFRGRLCSSSHLESSPHEEGGGGSAMMWLYWITRLRLALYRGDEETVNATVGAILESPFGAFPPLAMVANLLRAPRMTNGLSSTVNAAQLEPALAPFLNGTPRSRVIGLMILAEVAAYVGDAVTLRRSVEAVDAESSVDVDWLDRCAVLTRAQVRTEAWFMDVRERVAARAKQLDGVLVSLLGLARDGRERLPHVRAANPNADTRKKASQVAS